MSLQLECCGVTSYKDWLRSYYTTEYYSQRPELGVGDLDTGRVPESCCNEEGRINYPAGTCGSTFTEAPLETYQAFLHTRVGFALFESVLYICLYCNSTQSCCVALYSSSNNMLHNKSKNRFTAAPFYVK